MPAAFQEITVLNSLIATLLDSVEGYSKPLEELANNDLSERFRARVKERQRGVMVLRAALTVAGGNPEDDGTLVGSQYRAFFDLQEAVDQNDENAILEEVKRGEQYLNEMFGIAMKTQGLSSGIYEAIRETWEIVWQGHADMNALARSFH